MVFRRLANYLNNLKWVHISLCINTLQKYFPSSQKLPKILSHWLSSVYEITKNGLKWVKLLVFFNN